MKKGVIYNTNTYSNICVDLIEGKSLKKKKHFLRFKVSYFFGGIKT